MYIYCINNYFDSNGFSNYDMQWKFEISAINIWKKS